MKKEASKTSSVGQEWGCVEFVLGIVAYLPTYLLLFLPTRHKMLLG
jgi:hypothetical protein